ncbi:MAG: hypothetical protein WDO73_14765 [Ignavibacteriota bacterium]
MRWVVAALLFVATAINYADRLALSVISTDLRRAFAMTETDYSEVVAVFLIAYAVMYAFSGYVVESVGHASWVRGVRLCMVRAPRCSTAWRPVSGR